MEKFIVLFAIMFSQWPASPCWQEVLTASTRDHDYCAVRTHCFHFRLSSLFDVLQERLTFIVRFNWSTLGKSNLPRFKMISWRSPTVWHKTSSHRPALEHYNRYQSLVWATAAPSLWAIVIIRHTYHSQFKYSPILY